MLLRYQSSKKHKASQLFKAGNLHSIDFIENSLRLAGTWIFGFDFFKFGLMVNTFKLNRLYSLWRTQGHGEAKVARFIFL